MVAGVLPCPNGHRCADSFLWPDAHFRRLPCADMTTTSSISTRNALAPRARRRGRPRAPREASARRRHVHRRPQHQLHERLRRRLRLLRVLPAAEARRRVDALVRADRRQDRRGQGARRRADPHAGRAQSVHPVRVVSRPAALHQEATTRSTSTASARAKWTSSPRRSAWTRATSSAS